MSASKKYKKKPDQFIVAVQLDLDTDGFEYKKWDATQRCRAGDWLVFNHGDTYTIAADVFARTYEATGPGHYVKLTPVWARVATESGSIKTKEGSTAYQRGDYIVYNDENETDGYAVSGEKFESMYQACTD